MAGVPGSQPPMAPPMAAHVSAHRITIRHNGSYVQVESNGVPLRYLTDIGVSFLPGSLPEVRVSMAPMECDVQLEDGTLVIDAFEMPDAFQRALYEHLRLRFGSPGRS